MFYVFVITDSGERIENRKHKVRAANFENIH